MWDGMQHRTSGYLPWEGTCFFSGSSHSCGGNVQLLQSKHSSRHTDFSENCYLSCRTHQNTKQLDLLCQLMSTSAFVLKWWLVLVLVLYIKHYSILLKSVLNKCYKNIRKFFITERTIVQSMLSFMTILLMFMIHQVAGSAGVLHI